MILLCIIKKYKVINLNLQLPHKINSNKHLKKYLIKWIKHLIHSEMINIIYLLLVLRVSVDRICVSKIYKIIIIMLILIIIIIHVVLHLNNKNNLLVPDSMLFMGLPLNLVFICINQKFKNSNLLIKHSKMKIYSWEEGPAPYLVTNQVRRVMEISSKSNIPIENEYKLIYFYLLIINYIYICIYNIINSKFLGLE